MPNKVTKIVKVSVDIPVGATHYRGSLPDHATFFKWSLSGVKDIHWAMFYNHSGWVFFSDKRPPNITHLDFC